MYTGIDVADKLSRAVVRNCREVATEDVFEERVVNAMEAKASLNTETD